MCVCVSHRDGLRSDHEASRVFPTRPQNRAMQESTGLTGAVETVSVGAQPEPAE
jgi:hypothetical protein